MNIWHYVGEETINNLLGNNPYRENNPHYNITYIVESYIEANDVITFFMEHIPKDRFALISVDNLHFSILIKNDFGCTSEVEIIWKS